MGRPVKRDVAGNLVFGDYTTASAGILVTAYFGGSSHADCFIVKQKGARRYLVQDKSSGEQAICKLVSSLGTTEKTMVMTGITNPSTDAGVAIAKLQKRLATDFSSNHYKWTLVNDSSADYILLTAV